MSDNSLAPVARIARVLDALVVEVESWSSALGQLDIDLASAAGRHAVDACVQGLVHGVLCDAEGLISGAGFVSAPGADRDQPVHVSWWTRDDLGHPRREDVSLPLGNPQRRYTALEWWRASKGDSTAVLVGPYVDYPGTGTTVMSITAPVGMRGAGVGVVVADLQLLRLERALGPLLDEVGPSAAIVGPKGRVVLASDPAIASGDIVAGREATASLPVGTTSLRVIVNVRKTRERDA